MNNIAMLLRAMQNNGRRQMVYLKLIARRKNVMMFLMFMLFVLYTCLWPSNGPMFSSDSLMMLRPDGHNHLRRNLGHYIDNIHLLIEPKATPCARNEEIPLLTLVASAPGHHEHREAIRQTWAKYQRVYFVLGFDEDDFEIQMSEFRSEAKEYDDIIVFDFDDNFKNSTLKTALMIHWTRHRCPQAEFLMKTVDGTLVNPWAMRALLLENRGANLLGYVHTKKVVYSEEYNKWYHWMFNVDIVPQYLDGAAYLIRGDILQMIMTKAYEAPLISLEDIYFTYVVAYRGLRLGLLHDWRLSPKRPRFDIACAYWTAASTHEYSPEQMMKAWRIIEVNEHMSCGPFLTYLLANEWLLV